MAVDANVLIFARIREELANRMAPQMAIHAGFERAVATILDANITTLIVAVILYAVGTGPIKGFAVTLSLGILTSMFTAILGTRALINLIYGGRRVDTLSIGTLPKRIDGGGRMTVLPFMKWRFVAAAISILAVAIAVGSLSIQQLNWGLDFTGGTLVEVEYAESADLNGIRGTLDSNGYQGAIVVSFGTDRDVLVRLPQGFSDDEGVAMVEILRDSASVDVALRRVEFVGPQIGDELREQGGLAMLLALGLVMLYVGFRFQFKFAVGAVVALVHDVLLVLGFFSLAGIEFDLTVLAALLAVIGYSLNDTIVVADRIRENFRKLRRISAVDVINVSLTETLGRTLVTSLTTLLVLSALALFGGEMIHGFAVALLIGVAIGTYSSMYVSATTLVAMGVSKEDVAIPIKEGLESDETQP